MIGEVGSSTLTRGWLRELVDHSVWRVVGAVGGSP